MSKKLTPIMLRVAIDQMVSAEAIMQVIAATHADRDESTEGKAADMELQLAAMECSRDLSACLARGHAMMGQAGKAATTCDS